MTIALTGKTVFITGASSGIGQAAAEQFAAAGCRLIMTARRLDRLQTLAQALHQRYQVEILPLLLDVRDNAAIKRLIAELPPAFRDIDILVNNAGLALSSDLLQEGDPENWDVMIDTNIKGLLYVSRAILPLMLKRNTGHIVNVGSVAGHDYYPKGNIYVATKHAVKAITQAMRLDLLGAPIRVTEIAPGAVATEFSAVRWQDKQRADDFYNSFISLTAEDVADTILYAVSRPLHVNVSEIIIMPTVQASCNHLQKKN